MTTNMGIVSATFAMFLVRVRNCVLVNLNRLSFRRKRRSNSLVRLHWSGRCLLVNLYTSTTATSDTLQNRFKRSADSSRIIGRGLDKGHVVFLSKSNGFFRLHSSLVV